MINRLSDSKYFSFANAKFNFNNVFSKINWNEYKIPNNFIIDKVNALKSFKYPLVDDIIKAVKDGKLVLVDLNESPIASNKMGDIHVNYKFPKAIFNLQGIDAVTSEPIIYVDLSYKGKYLKDGEEYVYYDIPDITLFHMLSAGYIQYKLFSDPNVSLNSNLYTKIAECYALIMTKIVDNMFPIISTDSLGASKLHFLSLCFCMEALFRIDKETACKHALKSKFVTDKIGIQNELQYLMNDKTFVDCDYKTEYPIDKFCKIVCEEFEHIDPKGFTSDLLHWRYNYRLGKTAIFCLDSASCFINMIYFGKYKLGIYNDFIIDQYLKIASGDIIKEIVQIIKDK